MSMLPFYSDWQAGRLPVDGGVLDQSNYFVESMRCLEQAASRLEADEAQQRMSASQKPHQTGDDLKKMFGSPSKKKG